MNKQCQNCKNSFEITNEDMEFYNKISVPAPTFCPECRFQRRGIFRNERTLYRRKCDLCQKDIISLYSSDKPYKVYCRECYSSDNWDSMESGMEIDFSKPFLEQFKELQLKVPRLYAFVSNNVNSPYVNGAADNKNCYLIFVSDHNEDSMYSHFINSCRNTIDSFNSDECELCYEAIACKKCYQVYFSESCSSSTNLYFCKNCTNCSDCVGSVNLKNQQYHIFNQQYSKEEYFKKLEELGLDSFSGLGRTQKEFFDFKNKFINKFMHGQKNVDVLGDFMFDSKNVDYGYDSNSLEDCKYVIYGNGAKNCYDFYVNVDGSQFSYEVVSGIALNNVKFGYAVWNNYDLDYCDTCENSNNLFGCVGLRKKQYCILNKQYDKETYVEFREKIIQHMDTMPYIAKRKKLNVKSGNSEEFEEIVYRYGEFFPPELSPFAYNETVAQQYFPLNREETELKGYQWKDSEEKNVNTTIQAEDLPGKIKSVDDSILKEIIGCGHKGECGEQCTKAFKITAQELEFYRKMNLPLPRLCPNCRHAQRIKQRNPLKLWKRKCMCNGKESVNSNQGTGKYQNTSQHSHGDQPCPSEFETTYAPDRPEIVYCEQCYQIEVS